MATEKGRVTLYNGEIEVDFYPNSHRYKEVKSGKWIPGATTITGMLDKSRVLINWAVNTFHNHFVELMEDAKNFTRDDVLAMLSESKDAHNIKKESACDIGSVVHDYADEVGKHEIEHGNDRSYLKIKDELIPKDDFERLSPEEQENVINGMNAFDEWVKKDNPKFLETEFLVYSRKHHHGGTADGLVEIDGKIYLLDYKTSKGIYSSHLYQSSSYMKAKEEEWEFIGDERKIDGVIIVQIHKADVVRGDEVIHKAGDVVIQKLSRGELVKAYVGFKSLLSIYNVEKNMRKILK